MSPVKKTGEFKFLEDLHVWVRLRMRVREVGEEIAFPTETYCSFSPYDTSLDGSPSMVAIGTNGQTFRWPHAWGLRCSVPAAVVRHIVQHFVG